MSADQNETVLTSVSNAFKRLSTTLSSSPTSTEKTELEYTPDSTGNDVPSTPQQSNTAPATPSSKRSTVLNTSIQTPIKFPSSTPGQSKYVTEQTPSVIKNEARQLLKKLDSSIDDIKGAEDLYALCLFASNRANMLDTGVLSALALALKTKTDRVKEISARILQLFAQDGGEACIMLKRLNMCNSSIEILSKSEDINVQVPVVGLIYWLIQNPACKKEFIDMGADTYLKEINNRTKEPMLSRYLNYAISSLSVKVKSREEMMQELLAVPSKPSINTEEMSNSLNQSLESLPYQTPSPRHFFNLFKTPSTQHRSPTSTRKLDFSTPQVTKTKTPENTNGV